MSVTGGLGEAKPAGPEEQSIVDSVKSQIEGKLNRKFTAFKAVSVATQVVSGKNYFVKIHLGGDEYLHARIYKHFSDAPVVDGVQYPKKKDDPVVYFDK